MQDIQHKAAVAGFIHALYVSKPYRDKWADIRVRRDWAAMRALIAETVGLAQTPNEEDLEAMRVHSERTLMPRLEELHNLDQRMDPNCICNGRDNCP